MTVAASAAAVDDPWSATDLAQRLAPPLVVLLVGVMVFVRGRTLRGEALAVTSRGGSDSPPGSPGAGSAEGPGDEERQARLRHATQRVLAGLLLMLLGSLGCLAVIVWRLVS